MILAKHSSLVPCQFLCTRLYFGSITLLRVFESLDVIMPNSRWNYWKRRSHKFSLRLTLVAACLILSAGAGGAQTTHSPILRACDASTYKGSDAGTQINAAEADVNCDAVDASKFMKPVAAATIKVLKPLILGAYTLTTSGNPGLILGTHSRLEGQGRNYTVVTTTSPTSDIIKLAPGANYSYVGGLTIQSAVQREGGAGLHIQGGNSVFREILINPVWNGIALDVAGSADNNQFDAIQISSGVGGSPGQGRGNAWNCGILNGGIPTGTVASNSFSHIQIVSTGPAFQDAMVCIQDGSDSVSFSDSQFVANVHGADGVAVHIERIANGNAPSWIKFTSSYFEGGLTKNAVVIDSVLTVDFNNCFEASSLRGMLVNAATRVAWRGGQFYNNRREAVRLTAAEDFDLSGARIGNNSLESANTFDDIFISTGVSTFKITDNTFKAILPTRILPKWNIAIAAGASDHYVVTGNIMPGFASTGAVSDGGKGPHKVICNPISSGCNLSGTH